MKKEKKCVGLNVSNTVQYIDHLAPICFIMKMPLLLTDERIAQEVRRMYPGVEVLLEDWLTISPEYLFDTYDVFFQSDYWHRDHFYSKFKEAELSANKIVRNVHCPHGFSDKLYWFEQAVWEDILLYYGENMLDLFKSLGIEEHLNATVRTGNYRNLYYKKHQLFYDQLIEEEIFSKLNRSKKTILYAPTNLLKETASFEHAQDLFENLPSDYNLIVKLHPNMEYQDTPLIISTMAKYEARDNIFFLRDYPLIYPILANSDIYVGDMSSIGYDFLAFDRPMFFLNQLKRDPKKDRNLFLYRCGVEILPEQYKNFYRILESQLPFDRKRYSSIRKEIYHYTFGDEIPFDELKTAITRSFETAKKFD